MVALSPVLASADGLNWTVWSGSRATTDTIEADHQPTADKPIDALVEAGLDDSPQAPSATAQADLIQPAVDVDSQPETWSGPIEESVIDAAVVLPEYESSGQVIDESATHVLSVIDQSIDELATETLEMPVISADTPTIEESQETVLAGEDEAIEAGLDGSPVSSPEADEVAINQSDDHVAAAPGTLSAPEPAVTAIATETPIVEESTLADELADERDATDAESANDAVPATQVVATTDAYSDGTFGEVPTIEPQLVVTPGQKFAAGPGIQTAVADDLVPVKSADAVVGSESVEEAAFAALEAEMNDTMILGPVAIAEDLAVAADGAEAVAEDASGGSMTAATDANSNQPGRYDELMSEIIKADRADGTYESADTSQPDPLLLERVLELALTNNPEVAMALAREEQARWGVREAGAYRSPTVDMVVELGPERNRPATNTSDIDDITPGRNLNLRISKLLYDGGVSVAEEDRRRQIRRSTEIETRLVIEEIVLKAVKSYMEILQNQQAARVAEEFVAEMQRMVNQISQMHESGAASKIELDFARSRLASARAQTGNSAAQLNDALSNLEFLTGDLPEFIAIAPIDVSTVMIDTLLNYVDTARNNNAAVLLNASNKTALSLKIRGQQAQYSPILSLNFKSESLADEGGNQDPRNTTEVKLKAEYFLIDGGVRKARIQRSKAQLMELEWDHERLVKDIDRRIKQSYNQITTNRLTLAATEDEIKANQELRRLNRQNLEIGDISILELIEVEERLFNSQATWYRISSEMLRNYYELLIGVGDLPAVLVEDYTSSRITDK